MNDEPIKCPKCYSTQIHVDKRGFKTGRAIAGGLVTGNILAAAASGGIGMNNIELTCLKCGHKFKIKDAAHYIPQNIQYEQGEYNTVICYECGGKTLSSHKYCCECGELLGDGNEKVLLESPLPVISCPECKLLSTKGKFCSKCGKEMQIPTSSNSGCASVILLLILVSAFALLL